MRTSINKQKKNEKKGKRKRKKENTSIYNNGYSIKQIFGIIFHFWGGGGEGGREGGNTKAPSFSTNCYIRANLHLNDFAFIPYQTIVKFLDPCIFIK